MCFNGLQSISIFKMLQMLQADQGASRLGRIFARERDEKGSSWCFLGFGGFRLREPWVQWVYLTQCLSIPWPSEKHIPTTAAKQCLCATRLLTRSHSIHRRFRRFCSLRYSDCTSFTRIVPRRGTRENDGVLHMIDEDLCILCTVYIYIYIIYIYIYNINIATRGGLCLLLWNALRASGIWGGKGLLALGNWSLLESVCMHGSHSYTA